MILRGQKATEVLDSTFMLREHREGMEAVMQNGKLLAAFRAAGPFSLEKLAFGAAAKPHSILAKTIKPEEVGLDGRTFDALSLNGVSYSEETWEETARRFLCGLVGIRKGREIVGLYVSSKGKELLKGNVIPSADGEQGMIRFSDLNGLLSWIKSLFISVKPTDRYALKLSPYFISGDYDIHEIQRKRATGTAYEHIPACSRAEAEILCELSKGALAKAAQDRGRRITDKDHTAYLVSLDKAQYDSGVVKANEYIPGEYSPIQHGAQDNYLDFMFRRESNEALVSKVLLLDNNIAVYCGERNEWCIIQNSPDSKLICEIRALYNQVDDMKMLYAEYGAVPEEHWDFEKDEVQIALMEMYGLTPKEFVERLQRKKEEVADLMHANPSDGKLREYVQFYDRLIKKYGVLLKFE